MRTLPIVILFLGMILSACSSSQSFSRYMGDDLYVSPVRKNHVDYQGQPYRQKQQQIDPREVSDAQREFQASQKDTRQIDLNQFRNYNGNLDVNAVVEQANRELSRTGNNQVQYQNQGYWIGGFKGNNRDWEEARSIINRYPEGFAYIANGSEIALNLSLDPDWNVYTENGRYWWFPSNTNIELYSQFLFGDYPRYIYTVIWNNPQFTAWDFDRAFNWSFNTGWNASSWNFGFGFGWNSSWYPNWNGWYNPCWDYGWCPPYYYGGYPHGHWHGYHPNWHNPHWGNGNHPNWGGSAQHRPVSGLRPNHSSSVRPNYNNNYNRPLNSNRPSSNRNEQMSRPINSNNPTNNVRPNRNVRPTNRPLNNERPTTTPQKRSTRTDYSMPKQQNRTTRGYDNMNRGNQQNTQQRTVPQYNRQSFPQHNRSGNNNGNVNRSNPPIRRNR